MKIPTALRKTMSQSGAHRRGVKALFYGGAKTGKSFAAASFPGPRLVAACGEPGIEPYLTPTVLDEAGEYVSGDVCFNILNHDDLLNFMKFAGLHHAKFETVVLDNFNLAWEAWMDHYNEKFDGEIAMHQWRFVKEPWKAQILRELMRFGCHVVITLWAKTFWARQTEGGPGEDGQTIVSQQDTPQAEKSVPYIFDFIFRCEVDKDKLNRPTHKHRVVFYGGRVPMSLHGKLYTGYQKTYSAKDPKSVWEDFIAPIYAEWSDGAVACLGPVEERETRKALKEIDDAGQQLEVGRLLEVVAKQTNLDGFQEVFKTQIGPAATKLTPERKTTLHKAIKAKKAELANKKNS